MTLVHLSRDDTNNLLKAANIPKDRPFAAEINKLCQLIIKNQVIFTCLTFSAKPRPMPMVEFPTKPLGHAVHLYPGCRLIQVARGKQGKYKHWKENKIFKDIN